MGVSRGDDEQREEPPAAVVAQLMSLRSLTYVSTPQDMINRCYCDVLCACLSINGRWYIVNITYEK